MAWGKVGSTTNTSSSVITISDISSGNKNIQTMFYKPSGSNSYGLEFNSDTGSNYHRRRSYDGGADQTGTKTAFPEDALYFGDYGEFMVTYIANVSGEEKLGIAYMCTQNTAGNYAPTRYSAVGKWVTTDEITSIRTESAQISDSNLTVLGSDLAPAGALGFVPNAQVGSRAEITDTRKMYYYSDTPTLSYDLSTSAGWTTTGSNCSVNTSGQYLQGSSSTNDDRATKALGLTLSDTKFVVRQKMELTTVTSGGNGQVYFGYTDKDNSTTVLGNRDGIGITIRSSPDFLQSYALNQYWQSSATLTTTPTATTYYLELIRNSATSYTLNLYSDSNYSVLVETKTNSIPSSVNGLNHITIGGWDNNASGVITARFSDIQIYNNVSTVSGFKEWKELGK